MRGEETQLAGLMALCPKLALLDLTVVLPGTHSKWVRLIGGQAQDFATHMTGEVFGLLREHSVLARLIEPSHHLDAVSFDKGVQQARRTGGADLMRLLFSIRSMGLFKELCGEAGSDYLSGLLIGAEVAGALASGSPYQTKKLVLIGEPFLCTRYSRALESWGQKTLVFNGGLAASGLHQLMRRTVVS